MLYIKLTHVGFRAHVKIASRIVSYLLVAELSSGQRRAVIRGTRNDTDLLVFDWQVMEEADVDEDDKLSYQEFQNIVARAPNFIG